MGALLADAAEIAICMERVSSGFNRMAAMLEVVWTSQIARDSTVTGMTEQMFKNFEADSEQIETCMEGLLED